MRSFDDGCIHGSQEGEGEDTGLAKDFRQAAQEATEEDAEKPESAEASPKGQLAVLARLFYTDHFALPLPPGHKFPIRKYRMLRELLARDGVFEFTPAPLADPADIALAHDPAYVQAFVEGRLTATVMRRIGFPWSEDLVARTLASAGGTLGATEDALSHGWGGTLAGGTHHALYAEGAGFCVFNDIAIAIRKLQRDGRMQRAAVIDLDVHQGDGTAAIFQGDSRVFTFSMHGAANFPFRKQQSRLDIGLPDGTGDDAYLSRLREALPEVMAFGAQIVFYQSGVDALASDRLGRLSLTAEGLLQRDRLVLEVCRDAGVPVVVTLGGGYSEPVELTVESHGNTFRMLGEMMGYGAHTAGSDECGSSAG